MNIKYMEEALELAKKSYDIGEVPVGAVIVCDGKIVGKGYNSRETQKNALNHAELLAIDEACKNLGGWRLWKCDMYVTLEPCPMCAGAIINSRIANLYYGAYDSKSGCCGSFVNLFDMGFNHMPNITGGILEDKSSELIKSFFKDLRKKVKHK